MELGDVVKLRSGGPKMTINAKPDFGSVVCSWFMNDFLYTGVFAAAALELVVSADHDDDLPF